MLNIQDFIGNLRRDLTDIGNAVRTFDQATMISWRNPREGPRGMTRLLTLRPLGPDAVEIILIRFFPLSLQEETTSTTRVRAKLDELTPLSPWIASGLESLPVPVRMRTVERKTLRIAGAHEAWIVYETERFAGQAQTRERIPRAATPACGLAVA
jgi:hypothetical protein